MIFLRYEVNNTNNTFEAIFLNSVIEFISSKIQIEIGANNGVD
jgi:hypothetical protein